jgi:hypothetical protein
MVQIHPDKNPWFAAGLSSKNMESASVCHQQEKRDEVQPCQKNSD